MIKEIQEVHPAFAWVCPHCGHLNYGSFIVSTAEDVGIDPEEYAEFCEEFDEDPEHTEFLDMPDKMFCIRCEEQCQTP